MGDPSRLSRTCQITAVKVRVQRSGYGVSGGWVHLGEGTRDKPGCRLTLGHPGNFGSHRGSIASEHYAWLVDHGISAVVVGNVAEAGIAAAVAEVEVVVKYAVAAEGPEFLAQVFVNQYIGRGIAHKGEYLGYS